MEKSITRVALVLGSGGFRGPAHIGVLARLAELHVPLYAMVGCSVGSLITACYAGLGMSVDELLHYAEETGALAVAAHALSTWDFQCGGQLARSWAEPVQRKLARLERCDFRSLRHGVRKIGFLMHDLKRGERVFAATGRERGLSVIEAVKASARLPGVFPPLRKQIDGLDRRLVDGALSCPTPVLHALSDPISATHVIAVELSSVGSRRDKSQLDRWQQHLGDRLAIVRPCVSSGLRLWGGSGFVLAWYGAGLEAFGPALARQVTGWTRADTGAGEELQGVEPELCLPGWHGRRAAIA